MDSTDKTSGGSGVNSITKAFATNKDKEEKGVWFNGPGGTKYLVARQGNKEFVKLAAHLTKPHRRLIDKGLADPELLKEISAEVTSRTVLLDWAGVTDDGTAKGKPITYTPALGKAHMLAEPDFADFIAGCSTSAAAYQDEDLKAAAGN